MCKMLASQYQEWIKFIKTELLLESSYNHFRDIWRKIIYYS